MVKATPNFSTIFSFLRSRIMAQENNSNNTPRGLSSFANLLGSNAGTISSAPVLYAQQPGGDDAPKDEAAAKKQQINSGTSACVPRRLLLQGCR